MRRTKRSIMSPLFAGYIGGWKQRWASNEPCAAPCTPAHRLHTPPDTEPPRRARCCDRDRNAEQRRRRTPRKLV